MNNFSPRVHRTQTLSTMENSISIYDDTAGELVSID
jgi:hypothetical protein